MHANRQIRDRAAALLVGGDAFRSVFTNRTANLVDAHLPAAVVGTAFDQVTLETKDDPPLEKREISLTVTIIADGDSETLDDDLDELRVAAESALGEDLDGLAWLLEHTGAELEMGSDEDGSRWFAFYALSWTVTVWTQQGNPEELQ